MSGFRRGPIIALLLLIGAAVAGCQGGHHSGTPTPLVGQSIANRDPLHQTEGCAPDSNPLALVLPALVRITTPPSADGTYSSGTGIIVDQGWVLTNQHVVDLAGDAAVKTIYRDGHTSQAKVAAADPDLDLALLQADTGDLPPVAWGDEGKLGNNSILFSVGYEFGATLPIWHQGRYVSTTVDRATGQAFIVSDLALQHGDSGGPLLNRCGQVIGINTARIPSADPGRKLGLSIPGFGARRWSDRYRLQ